MLFVDTKVPRINKTIYNYLKTQISFHNAVFKFKLPYCWIIYSGEP